MTFLFVFTVQQVQYSFFKRNEIDGIPRDPRENLDKSPKQATLLNLVNGT